jgi:hypothetical protein
MRAATVALVAGLAGWSSIAAAAPVEPKPIAPRPVETPEPAPEPGKPKPVQPKPAPRPTEPAPTQPQPPRADPRPTEPKPGEPRPTEPKPVAGSLSPTALPLTPLLPEPRLDLTPSVQVGRFGLGSGKGDVRPPEHRGATLGDDRDWKVQAAQVGVMVGAFGVLSVLCGNGRCAEALSDVVPGGRPEQGPQVDVNRGSGAALRGAR